MLLLVDNSRLTIGGVYSARRKIRTAIPQANLNYLSIYVADAKGFFKDEGLENETVVISGPLSIAALLSGDVDYSRCRRQRHARRAQGRAAERHLLSI